MPSPEICALTSLAVCVCRYYLFLLVQPDFWQHAYTVVVVLGASLVCATWVPNVEVCHRFKY